MDSGIGSKEHPTLGAGPNGGEAAGREATGREAIGMEAIGRRATGWGARNCGDLLGVSRGERSPDGMNPAAIGDGGGQMAEYQMAFPEMFQPLQSDVGSDQDDLPSYKLFDKGTTRAALPRQPSPSSESTFSGSGTPASSSSRQYAELHARLHPEGAYQQESYMGTGVMGGFLNRDGSSAQRQPRVYGHSASDCNQCIGFLTDSVQDATDLKQKKDEIIHELMPNAQNFQQKSIKGLAGYLKAGTDIQIRLLCDEPFRGNFDNTCVHQLIRLIKTKGKRLGHLVEYFSQEHSLRVDILRLVKEIHSNCPFCQAILQQWC
ncbi:uncharacterized protein [Haliotis cracherodii]|uniref:uncharacterized protein n=1 Tax=Haliotis cracherodii TaxID=6455 RepID=UPI0039E820B6